jgi:branched-chain amino acid transport system substrate-binding protein
VRSLRSVAFSALCVLTMIASNGCELTRPGDDSSDIVIAADLELSGATAAIGTAYRRALELKIDQINQRGVLGHRKIKLLYKDNRSDRTLSVSNIAEFASNDEVTAIITGACSSCVIAASKILNDKRVPAIALAPAREVATPVADRRYVFKLAPNPQDGAAALAAELSRARIRTIGLLSTDDEYGDDGETALTSELEKAGIDIKRRAQFKPTDTDLSQQVHQITEGKPDALVLWAYPTQAGIAAVSARAAGYEGRLYLDAAAAGDLFLNGPTAAATENAIMISTQTMAIDDVVAVTPAKAARKQWFRDYTSRYGGYFGYASYAADAVQIIADAIETIGGTERDRLRTALEAVQLDGLSGRIRITPDNHSGLMPQALTVLVARSGRWRLSS